MTTLQRLNEILEIATREGLLDDLQGYCSDPDSLNDVCDAVEALLRDRTAAQSYNPPKPKEDDFEGNTLLTVAGSNFRCPCGGNVFSKHKVDPNRYRCNICRSIFAGEK